MGTLTRKQREIREREQQILVIARQMLLERGYLGLNMDRIAEAIGYSKGTVYQHFSSKEDLLAALCVQTKRKRAEFIEQGVNLDGRPRERMTAVLLADEMFVAQYPDYSRTEELLYIESIAAKASEGQQQKLHAVEEHCINLIGAIINEAVACGDLSVPDHGRYQMVFGLWALILGSRSAGKSCETLNALVNKDTIGVLRANSQALLDGWGWRPLSSEWDYENTRRRAATEAFGIGATTPVPSTV